MQAGINFEVLRKSAISTISIYYLCIYIQIRWQVETSFLNCMQQTTNLCPSEIKCKERHLQQIDYFLYSFLPLLPSVRNTHLCCINIQYAYCILYSSSVAIWSCLTNKIKFQGNTNIQYAFCLCYDQLYLVKIQ